MDSWFCFMHQQISRRLCFWMHELCSNEHGYSLFVIVIEVKVILFDFRFSRCMAAPPAIL
jgi:hypothetical protein